MTKTINAPTAAFTFTGKGSQARLAASSQIAPLAFGEETSRAASLDNARKVLGTAPSDELQKYVRKEYIVGRIAARLPVSECRKGKTSPADRLELARDIVERMAAPQGEGKATRPLRKGQIARRSPVQHRVMRTAEDNASLFFADLGLSKARTLKEKNAKQAAAMTRAPSMAGSGKGKAAAPTAPTHSALVKAPKPDNADDVMAYVGQQARMLLDYVKKNAGVAPAGLARAVERFRGDVIAEANALQERKAIADAASKAAPATPAKKLVAVK